MGINIDLCEVMIIKEGLEPFEINERKMLFQKLESMPQTMRSDCQFFTFLSPKKLKKICEEIGDELYGAYTPNAQYFSFRASMFINECLEASKEKNEKKRLWFSW